MAVFTADDFLSLLERSALVPSGHFKRLRDELPIHIRHDSKQVADELVRRKLITSWQAQQLLSGRSQFVFGRYKLLEQVGVGGMGTVFKAQMTTMSRVVALKVMAKELLNNHEAVARFQREVRAVSALNHPNVVAAYDAICEGQTYFLVMEYVDGGNLNQWLKRFNPLPVDWCCEVIRQASLGLQHAHEHGIVHRDLKPGNILVSGDNPHKMPVVKLLDMGLARLTDDENLDDEQRRLTRQGQILGTPDYIAPEQAQDTRKADIRCDIYSLGVTLFKLLTGQLPFAGNTAMEKIMARNTHDAPRVRTLRSDILPGVEAVVAKMLARRPEDRYQTPAEVAQALLPFALVTKLSRLMSHAAGTSSIMDNAFAELLRASAQAHATTEMLNGSATEQETPPPGLSGLAERTDRTLSNGGAAARHGNTSPQPVHSQHAYPTPARPQFKKVERERPRVSEPIPNEASPHWKQWLLLAAVSLAAFAAVVGSATLFFSQQQ